MSQHTAGPWTYQLAQNYDGFSIMSQHRLPTLAGIFNSPDLRGEDETEANARLIAASPELLDALQDIVEQAEKTSMMLPADLSDSIRVFGKAAIAKATGLSDEPS